MACDQVVDFTAFALHPFACGLKIKFARSQNNVGKEFEKLNHGLLLRHGHHRVEDIAGLRGAEVCGGVIHLDAIGGRVYLV